MNQPYHPATIDLQHVLYALADPSRLNLVHELLKTPEIASSGFTSVEAARGTIAFHLKILRLAGITRTRLDGNRRLISLRRNTLDNCFPGLLDAILAASTPANPGVQA